MRERDVERRFALGIRALGGIAIKLAPTVAGLPDRLVLLPGGAIHLVELKAKSGRLRPIQEVWHARAAKIGHPVTVLTGPEQVDEFIERIKSE